MYDDEVSSVTRGNHSAFSVVIPVRDEAELIEGCFRSVAALSPDEVIFCLDDPPHEMTVLEIMRLREALGFGKKVRILPVSRNKEYKFHQALVRRRGFLSACNDLILTVDIDNIVNQNVFRALELVGKDKIGFASCLTMHSAQGIFGVWRRLGFLLSDKLVGPGLTGLYALWRPYWLQTSELETVKGLADARRARGQLALDGEDAHLCREMARLYRCVHLPVYGARCVRDDCNDIPRVQYEIGRYYAEVYGFFRVLIISVILARFHLLRGYIAAKIKRYVG